MKNLIHLFWKIINKIFYFSIVAGVLTVMRLIYYLLDPIENHISEKGITIVFGIIGFVISFRFILKKYLTSKQLI